MIVGGYFHKLIEQNTTVPTSEQHVFTTVKDNQTSVKILVLQGESDRADPEPTGGEPWDHERMRGQLASGEQRAEHERPEHRPGDGAEEHDRDLPRAALRGHHVRRRSAGEQHRPVRDADHREPEDDERRRVPETAEARDRRAAATEEAAPDDDGHPAVVVHQPAGRKGGERAGGQEDRRPEAEDPLDARDRDERDGAERGRELERAGVRNEATREEERVPADVAPHRSSVRRSPSANASAPPWEGWRT